MKGASSSSIVGKDWEKVAIGEVGRDGDKEEETTVSGEEGAGVIPDLGEVASIEARVETRVDICLGELGGVDSEMAGERRLRVAWLPRDRPLPSSAFFRSAMEATLVFSGRLMNIR